MVWKPSEDIEMVSEGLIELSPAPYPRGRMPWLSSHFSTCQSDALRISAPDRLSVPKATTKIICPPSSAIAGTLRYLLQ